MRARAGFAGAGAVVVALTAGAVATTGGWPGRLPLHLVVFVAAGVAWAGMLGLLRWMPRGRRDVMVLVTLAVTMRVPAWVARPAHSDDVYRYLWDGRVVRAGVNPYRYAPAAPELAALRDGGALAPTDF